MPQTTVPTAESCYHALLDSITDLSFKPGSPIREQTLALALKVSRTPIRDALARLVQEGFVAPRSRAGSIVAPLSIPRLKEALFILKNLCSAASIEACRNNNRHTLLLVMQAIEHQKAALEENDSDLFFPPNEAVFRYLFELAGYHHTWAKLANQKRHLDRLLHLDLNTDKLSSLIHDQALLLAAIAANRPEQAALAAANCLDRIGTDLTILSERFASYFEDFNTNDKKPSSARMASSKKVASIDQTLSIQ